MTDYYRFKRSKKRNFSEREVAILTDEYKKHMLILNSKLTNSITNQKKQRIWERITDAINSVGVNRRRVSEVKEKWRNMQRKARRIFAETKLGFHGGHDGPSSQILNSGGAGGSVRLIEKNLDLELEPLTGVVAASSTSASSTTADSNNSQNNVGLGTIENQSNHRNINNDDKPCINNSLLNDNNNNNNDRPDIDDHLTIVIKEEIPDPDLKNDELMLIQNEPVEEDLVDRTSIELVNPSIGCESSPPTRNPIGGYGFSSSTHKYNPQLVTTPEDGSSVYNTQQAQHWPTTHLQAPSQVPLAKSHPLSSVSMSSGSLRVPSTSLTSPRSYVAGHGLAEKANGIPVSSSLILNDSIPDTLASLSSNSFLRGPLSHITPGVSLSHVSPENQLGPGSSHSKSTNRGPSTSNTVTQADLLQLQYEVLLADKKRILTQTRYYEMKMKRIELELCGQTNSFF